MRGPARVLGRSGLGKGGSYSQGGGQQQSSSRLRLLRDATPEQPWAAPAAPRIPAHPRAPASLAGVGAPGEGSAGGADGEPQARASENRVPSPSPPFRPAPRERGLRPPLAPLLPPPIGSPLFSAIALPGRGRGCRALFLKGPFPFLSPGRLRARVGWGVPTGPRPPRSPSQLGSCSRSRGAGGTLRTPPPCVPQLPRPSWTP